MADIPNRTAPDNPLHEEKRKVGQPGTVDTEPKEFDNKTQHGGQSEARKGTKTGTDHVFEKNVVCP